MLSNMDLKKEFGKHIGLFPFIEKNIEGASIYFSASQYAWSLKSHQTVVNGDKLFQVTIYDISSVHKPMWLCILLSIFIT